MRDYVHIDTSEKFNWSALVEGVIFVSIVLITVFIALLLCVPKG